MINDTHMVWEVSRRTFTDQGGILITVMAYFGRIGAFANAIILRSRRRLRSHGECSAVRK